MQLTPKQRDELWGEDGPYSQANIKIQTRILDNQISRIFLCVEVEINPFTFKLCKKRRSHFKNDKIIQQLLDHAEYNGLPFGYVSSAFEQEFTNDSVLQEAKVRLKYSEEAIIRMHEFVMNELGIAKRPAFKMKINL